VSGVAVGLERLADRTAGQQREHLRGEVVGRLEPVATRLFEHLAERHVAVREPECDVLAGVDGRSAREGILEFAERGLELVQLQFTAVTARKPTPSGVGGSA
jgi:hypothetical protein